MGGSFLSPCRAFSSLLKERSRELSIVSDRARREVSPVCLVRALFLKRGAAGRGFPHPVRPSSTVRASASGWGNTGTQVTLSTGWKRREE